MGLRLVVGVDRRGLVGLLVSCGVPLRISNSLHMMAVVM